jgi:hypothetical protein
MLAFSTIENGRSWLLLTEMGVVWPLIIDQRLLHLTLDIFSCHRSHSWIFFWRPILGQNPCVSLQYYLKWSFMAIFDKNGGWMDIHHGPEARTPHPIYVPRHRTLLGASVLWRSSKTWFNNVSKCDIWIGTFGLGLKAYTVWKAGLERRIEPAPKLRARKLRLINRKRNWLKKEKAI